MPYHFNIEFSGDFAPVQQWLRQRAAEDPHAALAEGARGYFSIVFAGSPEAGRLQQEQFDAGRGGFPSLCEVSVAPDFGLLRVNLECGQAECRATAAFLIALLETFDHYDVFDEDSEADITAEVKKRPASLFE